MSSYADVNGNVVLTILDQAGQVVSTTDGAGPRYTYFRNSDNLVADVVDARRNTTSYIFDDRGNLVSIEDELAKGVATVDTLFPGNMVFNAGTNVTSLAVGDVDGDGHADLIVANANGLAVLIGDGEGSFEPLRLIASVSGADNIALGDLDHDNDLDVVFDINGGFSDTVSVLLGNGDGTFGPKMDYAVGGVLEDLDLGDLNGDGAIDLVAFGGTSTSKIVIFRGNGDGTLGDVSEINFAFAVFAQGALGDVDGDDDLDIVTMRGGNTPLIIIRGNGDGTFLGPEFQASPAGKVALGDLDADGDLDVIAGSAGTTSGTVSVLLGDGSGLFVLANQYTAGSGIRSVVLGDLGGDGDLDIVVPSIDKGIVSVLLGNGDGSFSNSTDYPVWGSPASAVIADLNEDGKLDVAVANNYTFTLSVLLADDDGNFPTSLSDYDVDPSQLKSLALGDLNGDRTIDIVTGNWNPGTVSVLLGVGDGSFVSRQDYEVGMYPSSVALGDLDRDGDLDIVTSSRGRYDCCFVGRTVSVLGNNGDGTFGNRRDFDVGDGPGRVVLGDVNGDGAIDLVTANEISRSISVLFGNGDGSFGGRTDYFGLMRPGPVTLLDVDADGALDLLIADVLTLKVRLGIGDGIFGGLETIATNIPVLDITTVDVDGDGDIDIITANSGDSVGVLLRNAVGTYAAATTYSTGPQTSSVAIGDVNVDGKPDIVTANSRGASFSVLLGNGDGTFTGSSDYAVPLESHGVAVGDLDADGDLDVVTANYSNVSPRLNSTFQPGGGVGTGKRIFCVPYRIFASFSCLSGRVIDLLENLSKPWVTRAR